MDRQAHEPGQHQAPYIPDRTFALALFDVIVTAGTDDSTIDAMLDDWIARFEDSWESLQGTGTLPTKVQQERQETRDRVKAILDSTSGHTQLVAKLKAAAKRTESQIRAAFPADHPALAVLAQVGLPVLDQLPRYLGSTEVVSGLSKLAAQPQRFRAH